MVIKDRLENKRHWFCFTYANSTGQASTYTGYDKKNVTIKIIEENKVNARIDVEGSVLIACIYLGEMTKEEFAEN